VGNHQKEPERLHQLDFGRRTGLAGRCSYRVKSKSVIIEGIAEIVEDDVEKLRLFNQFMTQYSDLPFKFNAPAIRNVGVLIVPIGKLTAKEFGAKSVTPWNK
jgi:hypothetical protein